MAARYWIKAWIEILDDPKMGHLPDRAWRRAVELFLVAGEMNRDGHIPDTDQLAWRLRCDPIELAQDLDVLAGVRIIEPNSNGWIVRRFADRQAPVSDAKRQTYHRQREKARVYYGHEPVTIRDTDQIQIREEQNRSDASAQKRQRESSPETALWDRVSNALRLQLVGEIHSQLFGRAKIRCIDAGQVVIAFPSQLIADRARDRLGRVVVATVSRELGRDVAVEYEVMELRGDMRPAVAR